MSYQKQNFVEGQTLTHEHLNHIEDGIIANESTSGSNILYGKRILAIGDSFVYGHTLGTSASWATKIANRNNMTVKIHATNGISLSGPNSSTLAKQIDSVISSFSSADYVLLLAGHNDANPTMNGGTAVPMGTNDDTNHNTFKGGLNYVINKLLTAYPKAQFLFLTPFNRRGIEEPYAEAMKEICGIWCVPCFDNYHNGNMCFQHPAQQSAYELSGSLHYNDAGLERLSYLYENILRSGCAINYSTPPKTLMVDSADSFNAITNKNPNTIYLVKNYGVFYGSDCIISTT
jgi:lysophospholipase L1-like esterase